jgi:D-alanyl-D-alanine dipeptidase
MEFVVPALYSSSIKLAQVQSAALADGNTIVLYEAFRPHETQMSIVQNLRDLMGSNQTVRNTINSNGWSEGWFVAQSRSSHQRGSALDVSLARVIAMEIENLGGYEYTRITAY